MADLNPISPARRAAFDILCRKGFASDELRGLGSTISTADAGLATELVMGCLRRQRQLDAWIAHASGRDPDTLDEPVRVALRMGIYQIWKLDRVPGYAAVSESVSLVRRARIGSAAGFVNAVLRKVRRPEPSWGSAAVEWNLPDWLWAKWTSEMGWKRAQRVAAASLEPPQTWIRVPAGREEEAASLGATPTEVPGCWRAGQGTGGFRIQDIGSQSIVARHLDVRPGMKVLDIAAAPGNKTAQILEVPGVFATACDASWQRLAEMGGIGCARVRMNGRAPLPFAPVWDRVLLDAPCSGTGTIGRNPEIKWRVSEEDIRRHAERQRQMLVCALAVLAPGGKLVYSTCSLENEENEMVVEAALAETGNVYKVLEMRRRTPGEDAGDGFFAAMLASRIR
ncbi:MAG: transcription antitermination factor NusB [Bryobacteraceae bacterium]